MRRLLAGPLRGRASADPVESIPRGDKLILLAFKHVLVAYAGAVAVPLVIGAALNLDKSAVAFLVSADLLVTGIAILIQNIGFKGVGIRLPLVLGSSFVTLPSMILIGQTQGLPTAYGAVIVAGILASCSRRSTPSSPGSCRRWCPAR
jgi:NCS2 family nucleobase:cation symporter-2